MRYFLGILALLFLTSSATAAERFVVHDEGIFAPTGRLIEFADKYGWKSYRMKFSFGFDDAQLRVTEGSKLALRIEKKDGSHWAYKCRNRPGYMRTNVNPMMGGGISILVECLIPPKDFSWAVGLKPEQVGVPTLVVHVIMKERTVKIGAQKGFYFLAVGQMEASEMQSFATHEEDPSELTVLFRTDRKVAHN